LRYTTSEKEGSEYEESAANLHREKQTRDNHPIIQSFQPGEDWRWCYIDQVML